MEAGGWGISSTLQLSCRFLATAAGCKQPRWREGVAAASSSVGAAPCSCNAATAGVQLASRLLLSLRYLTSRLQADVEGVHPLVTNAARRLQLLLRLYAAGPPPPPASKRRRTMGGILLPARSRTHTSTRLSCSRCKRWRTEEESVRRRAAKLPQRHHRSTGAGNSSGAVEAERRVAFMNAAAAALVVEWKRSRCWTARRMWRLQAAALVRHCPPACCFCSPRKHLPTVSTPSCRR